MLKGEQIYWEVATFTVSNLKCNRSIITVLDTTKTNGK